MSGCSCVWLQFTGNSILFISTKSEHVHPMPSPPTGPYVRLEVRTIASIITARAMIKAYTAFFLHDNACAATGTGMEKINTSVKEKGFAWQSRALGSVQ